MDSLIRLFTTPAGDFGVFYYCTKYLIEGLNPYLNPDIFTGLGYPVNSLLFFIPFSTLPYQMAQNIFTFISLFCLYFSIWISLKILNKKAGVIAVPVIFFISLLSFPVKFTLGMGQNNLLALAFLLLSYWFFKKEKPILSGILLGFAINIKTIFLFYILFYLIKNKYKLVLISLFTVFVLVITTGVFFGWSNYVYYFREEVPQLLNLVGREIYYNQGFMGFLSRIINNIEVRKTVGYLVSAVLVGVVSFFVKRSKNDNLGFSLFIITLLFVDSLSWQHHFVWLLFPMILIGSYVKDTRSKILGLILLFSYLLIGVNIKSPYFGGIVGITMSSHVFWGLIVLAGLNVYLFGKGKVSLPKKFL